MTEGASSFQMTVAGDYSADTFSAGFDSGGQGTLVTLECFCDGTEILTERGPLPVELLRVGELVAAVVNDGFEPVTWIDRRQVDCARQPDPSRVWPVRVAADAFGAGRPHHDLYLSPDHAVFVNDVLIPVRLLVNGWSIAPAPRERVTYFHVELPVHAVILAEGLEVESYLDAGDRANFHADDGLIRLFPDFTARRMVDVALTWEARGAAPLVVSGPRLIAARGLARNAARCRGGVISR